MPIKIGYGGDRHGHYRPHRGRGMSDIERIIHLIASMQILFGSRRGGMLLPLLILVVCIGGWYAYNQMGPENKLRTANGMWDTGDSKDRIQAIRKYKEILKLKDPLEPGLFWLKDDREVYYRRIVEYHIRYDKSKEDAREWILAAGKENVRPKDMILDLSDDDDRKMYEDIMESIKGKSKTKRDRILNSDAF